MKTFQPSKPARILHDEEIFKKKTTVTDQTVQKDMAVESKETAQSQEEKPVSAPEIQNETPPQNTPMEPENTIRVSEAKVVSATNEDSPPGKKMQSSGKVLIEARNIFKSFFVAKEETKVLKDVSLKICEEDFLVIVGPSGSGKSTLLHILLGLEIPTSGELYILGKDLYKDTTEDMRSEQRKQHIGMVYQQPNWIKSMSVIENVAFPLVLRGYRKDLAHEIALGALKEVRMEMHAHQPPTELSGGQQQRVSLARCIVHNPEIVVADEPTGNLDYESGQEVMQLLHTLNIKDKKTVIMVTHDIEYIKFANCAINIFDGKIAGYYDRDHLQQLSDQLHTKHLDRETLMQANAQKTL